MRLTTWSAYTVFLALATGMLCFGQHHGAGAPNLVRGGAAISGVRSGAIPPVGPTPIGLQPAYSGYTGINPGAIRTSSFGRRLGTGRGNNRRGIGYGFYAPFGYAAPYYSTYDSGSIYGDPALDQAGQTSEVTAELSEQVQRLANEVQQMRAMQQPYTSNNYGEQSAQADPPAPAPPITLVMRTGQQVQVQSYAVMGGNIWDFTKQPAKRIPIANVDLAASTKATEASGAEFPEIQ